jgi:hypothetical protein
MSVRTPSTAAPADASRPLVSAGADGCTWSRPARGDTLSDPVRMKEVHVNTEIVIALGFCIVLVDAALFVAVGMLSGKKTLGRHEPGMNGGGARLFVDPVRLLGISSDTVLRNSGDTPAGQLWSRPSSTTPRALSWARSFAGSPANANRVGRSRTSVRGAGTVGTLRRIARKGPA